MIVMHRRKTCSNKNVSRAAYVHHFLTEAKEVHIKWTFLFLITESTT